MSRSIKKYSKMSDSYSGSQKRVSHKLRKKFVLREFRIQNKDTLKKVVFDLDSDILFPVLKNNFYSGSNIISTQSENYKKYLRK